MSKELELSVKIKKTVWLRLVEIMGRLPILKNRQIPYWMVNKPMMHIYIDGKLTDTIKCGK